MRSIAFRIRKSFATPHRSRIVVVRARERSLDTVACLGSSDLDSLQAYCRGSDNLVASDRDDLDGAAAK